MVRELGQQLQTRGLRVWLDEWELIPGRPWQEAIEEIIQITKSAAVLVGKDGLGPWEIPEMRACLSEFVDRQRPVIPVLLPDAPAKPSLPLFLKQFTWVDLRGGITPNIIDRLVWGITGKKVGASLTALTASAHTAAPSDNTRGNTMSGGINITGDGNNNTIYLNKTESKQTPMALSAPTESGALKTWQAKLEYLQQQEAITASPALRFELAEQIKEAKAKIAEYGE